jgi:hypothetical protein
MPGKSKHGRGKHRGKFRQRPATPGFTQQAAQAATPEAVAAAPAAPAAVSPNPSPAAVTPKTRPTAKGAPVAAAAIVDRSEVISEVKRIALFTAIVVVVLIVLTLAIK